MRPLDSDETEINALLQKIINIPNVTRMVLEPLTRSDVQEFMLRMSETSDIDGILVDSMLKQSEGSKCFL
jgi:hypothetical protein